MIFWRMASCGRRRVYYNGTDGRRWAIPFAALALPSPPAAIAHVAAATSEGIYIIENIDHNGLRPANHKEGRVAE
jgi:hypothetical protein